MSTEGPSTSDVHECPAPLRTPRKYRPSSPPYGETKGHLSSRLQAYAETSERRIPSSGTTHVLARDTSAPWTKAAEMEGHSRNFLESKHLPHLPASHLPRSPPLLPPSLSVRSAPLSNWNPFLRIQDIPKVQAQIANLIRSQGAKGRKSRTIGSSSEDQSRWGAGFLLLLLSPSSFLSALPIRDPTDSHDLCP